MTYDRGLYLKDVEYKPIIDISRVERGIRVVKNN